MLIIISEASNVQAQNKQNNVFQKTKHLNYVAAKPKYDHNLTVLFTHCSQVEVFHRLDFGTLAIMDDRRWRDGGD